MGIGASRGGGEEEEEREGEEARMRKEREASNGFREREERQNAVAIPVRCRVSRIFPGSDDENSHGNFVRLSAIRVARRPSWIFGRAVS